MKEVEAAPPGKDKTKSACRWTGFDTLLAVVAIVGALTTITVYYSIPYEELQRPDVLRYIL